MVSNKITDLEALILNLFNENKRLRLQDIAQHAGLNAKKDKDRRTIQRALTRLIKKNIIQAQGQARARIYIITPNIQTPVPIEDEKVFNTIPLLEDSTNLLRYISKPIQTRPLVGYNQDFLQSYIPNKTPYLSTSLCTELRREGNAEPIIRPAGTYARTILNRLLIDLSWNSSRLEGNTYSILETKRLIELGENPTGKNAAEAQMILNHKDAIEYIIEGADERIISAHEICSIHALLSDNLLGDPSSSGRLRQIAVGISGTTYLPLDNPHILKDCFDTFIQKLNLINDPFEQSFFAMVHLSYMQAFEDVNKRTARITANIPLIKCNFKPLSFIDVNQTDYVLSLLGVYEKNDISLLRDLYVWAYKRSSQRYSAVQQSMGEPNLFKLKYRVVIQHIIRTLILEKITGDKVVPTISQMIKELHLSAPDSNQLFQIIETEILSLHDGNIARFKIRPSEFQEWGNLQ